MSQGVATRVWNHVNFGRDLRARWNCNSLACLHRKRKLTDGGKEWSGSGGGGRCVASLFDSVCVAFKTEIICLLICRQAKGCARFVSFGFLLLSSTFILYCCLFLAGFFSIPVFLYVFCNSLLLCFLFLPLLRIYNSQCSTISAAVKVIAKISIAIDSKFNKFPFSTTLTPPPFFSHCQKKL